MTSLARPGSGRSRSAAPAAPKTYSFDGGFDPETVDYTHLGALDTGTYRPIPEIEPPVAPTAAASAASSPAPGAPKQYSLGPLPPAPASLVEAFAEPAVAVVPVVPVAPVPPTQPAQHAQPAQPAARPRTYEFAAPPLPETLAESFAQQQPQVPEPQTPTRVGRRAAAVPADTSVAAPSARPSGRRRATL